MADTGGQKRTYDRSLGPRYVGLMLAIVVAVGLILGLAVSLSAVRNAAEERQRSLEYAAGVVAASLLPVIADEDPARIEARLETILRTSDAYDVERIEIDDVEGNVIAGTEPEGTSDVTESPGGVIGLLTEPQLVSVPVEVEGLRVGTVKVQFRPVGLDQALYEPLQAVFVSLALTMVVAGLWAGWLVLRTVVEPIGELRDAAAEIADGERDIRFNTERNDEIGELAAALRDMTKQLEIQEQQLLESYESLEGAYNEQADLANQLERTMSMKSDFVAVASHEIRSPLAVIQLYSEMLEDSEFGDIGPELAEAVEAIVGAVTRLSSIVSSLLDVAMLERGVMTIQVDDVHLDELVGQAVADAEALATDMGIEVEVDGGLPETWVRGDRVRLRQAIDNLMSNAVKYSSAPSTVSVRMRRDEASVRIDIVDRGIGVPADRAEVLFQFFGRADTADSAPVAGLGLGLPIADRIVRAHKGEIAFADNPEGTGTVFSVTLPLGTEPLPYTEAVRIV